MTMLIQFIVAMGATITFSLLFGVPAKYYPVCGLTGGAGWLVYSLMLNWCPPAAATLLATVVVVLFSRTFAIWKKCPVTVFLISGIFPLVPGAGVYRMAYYLVMDNPALAMEHGFQALKMAVAIVLGIVLVLELPQKLFKKILRHG